MKNITDKYVPNNLRAARLAIGLRQLDVANKLGFTSTDRISRWEKGQAYPHIFNLLKLAAIYEVRPHELYEDLYKGFILGLSSPSSVPSYRSKPEKESQLSN